MLLPFLRRILAAARESAARKLCRAPSQNSKKLGPQNGAKLAHKMKGMAKPRKMSKTSGILLVVDKQFVDLD